MRYFINTERQMGGALVDFELYVQMVLSLGVTVDIRLHENEPETISVEHEGGEGLIEACFDTLTGKVTAIGAYSE